MLNESLKLQLIIQLNGRMLHGIAFFKHFKIPFLSELTFLLQKDIFSVEEIIFKVSLFPQQYQEGSEGNSIHFITKGNVYIIHKRTQTFIKELGLDDFFGEVSFMSNSFVRKATIKSKNFTETLCLQRDSFERCLLMQDHDNYVSMV